MKVLRAALSVFLIMVTVGVSPLLASEPFTYRPDIRWPLPTWHLSGPSGLAVDSSGNVYVADTDNNCVRKYSSGRVLVGTWGSLGNGDGQFNRPMDVAVDGSGHVYVADSGNHRIQKLTDTGTFVGRWGSEGGPDLSGSGDGEFNDPRSLGVDGSGNVYVADTGNSRVQKFTTEGTFLTKWGHPGSTEGQFYYPAGIAVETSGTVFVADTDNYRIQEFGPNGEFVNQFGVEGGLISPPEFFKGKPVGVAVDNQGNLYVSDSLKYFSHRIMKFTRGGIFEKAWGGRGAGDGLFMNPLGLSCDTFGNVWVADSKNDRVQWFAPEGTLGQVLGSWGVSPGRLRMPSGVAVGPSGDVYIADTANHRVQRFSSTGALLGVWPAVPPPYLHVPRPDNGYFNNPVAVATDADGNVFVADRDYHRIQKFTREGAWLTKWGALGTGDGYFNRPSGIAVDGVGNVYVADTRNYRVQKFDNNGNFIRWWGGRGETTGLFEAPEGIAADTAGNIFVADTGNTRVQRFSSDGEFVAAWGAPGEEPGQFVSPAGIAVSPNGSRVLVTDRETNRVQAFTASGAYLTQFGMRGPEEGQLFTPLGVVFAAPNLLYVADTGNHRIQRFVEYEPVGITIAGVSDGAAYRNPVTPTVSFTGATLKSSSITLNGELWAPETVEAEGTYTLRAQATDIYDYQASETVLFFVDMTAPAVSDDAVESYEGRARITLSATDGISGVRDIAYELNDGNAVVVSGETAVVEVNEAGNHQLTYRATDNAGNTASGSAEFTVVSTLPPVLEVAGSDRFATAVEASKLAYPGGAGTVVIATGRNWPDALGGSALAGLLDAPVLLSSQDNLPAVTSEEITRLGATKAIILGGPAAVGVSVETALAERLGADNVSRIAGGSRYETAEEIALRVKSLLGETYDGTAFVATGSKFPDALAAAPLAAANGWPIYLAHPSLGLSDDTKAVMAGTTSALILGGTEVVSPATESYLRNAYGDASVTRLYGSSRYDTAAAVAEYGVTSAGLSWNRVGIATGQRFPDALAGGVVQGKAGTVMLLTRSTSLEAATQATLSAHKAAISTVTFFGGENAIEPAVRAAVVSAALE